MNYKRTKWQCEKTESYEVGVSNREYHLRLEQILDSIYAKI